MMNDKGFSLIELMVSMVIGLVVLTATFTFFNGNLRANNTTLEMARLNQELQSVMTMMVRDIRRSGYHSDAVEDFSEYIDTESSEALDERDRSVMFSDSDLGDEVEGVYSCIILKTHEIDEVKVSGYRLDGTVIDRSHDALTCDGSGWQAITSNDIEITQFNLMLESETMVAVLTEPQTVQAINIEITGQVAGNTALSLSLSQKVRIRNNAF